MKYILLFLFISGLLMSADHDTRALTRDELLNPPKRRSVLQAKVLYDQITVLVNKKNWDEAGPGSTFRKYYAGYEELVLAHNLDATRKPTRKDISSTIQTIGYNPKYSLLSLLKELERYGAAGSPKG